ncbi:glycosyl transferase [Phreatobacter stygius]|uniref:Glycosyl transferase n=1 Tax=Phreatobacter stygius TaxID=1940610 RepID=A0A4D7B5B1_9HYPH|nr:glycosyl transferase [Phreatobacter stygius]QCI63197.1 glycosyl transferase [Phreatobacter stygius]
MFSAYAALVAAISTWVLIALSRPLLTRLALARPNGRSSHRQPVPQGAGLAMVAAALVIILIAYGTRPARDVACLAFAVLGLTALGFADDIRPLRWRLKLGLQALCCVVAVAGLPASLRLVPVESLFWAERAVMALALLAMVNIVNFIDGIDEISAAHAAPALAAAAIAGALSLASATTGLTAATGFGAVAGFWLWNRHPARIFLGDAGSLPLGLVIGWLAIHLSAEGALAAGLLIVLYPVADATITLADRLRRGRNVAEPHRDHGYQRAVDSGLPVRRVAATVALVASATAVLALVTLAAPHPVVQAGCLVVGLGWVVLPITGWIRRKAPSTGTGP